MRMKMMFDKAICHCTTVGVAYGIYRAVKTDAMRFETSFT